MLLYHTTVVSGLQAVARLARLSPYIVKIVAPLGKAQQVAERQVDRYPSITAPHTTRTALRRAGYPAVQLVVMPPRDEQVTMYLMSQDPVEGREIWRYIADLDEPTIWGAYQFDVTDAGRATWRLSEAKREHYRHRIARLITGRGGVVVDQDGRRRAAYQPTPEAAHKAVSNLIQHLGVYPGFAGVRADLFALAQYSTRVWNSTHPKRPYPVWPRHPTLPYIKPRTAPLYTITQHPQEEPQYGPEEEGSNDSQP